MANNGESLGSRSPSFPPFCRVMTSVKPLPEEPQNLEGASSCGTCSILYSNVRSLRQGPLLFILYVNDIYSVIHHSKHGMFADDLSIYMEVSTPADCALLQHDLDGIVRWSNQWQLQLNCSKCEALNVSNKRSPLMYTYTISNQPIQWSHQCRYLGVLIDSHLRWKAHCRDLQ